jgi:branched-chain amino acid transport system permease protein
MERMPMFNISAEAWITSVVLPGLALGMLYFLIAAGLSLIFGLMDVLNFAHGSLFMLGAYIAWTLATYTNPDNPAHWGLTIADSNLRFVAGLLLASLLVGGLGAALESGLIRPLYARPIYQVLLTLGLVLVCAELVKAVPIWGPLAKSLDKPDWFDQSIKIVGNRRFPSYGFFIIGLGAGVMAGIVALLRFTRLGLIVRAGVQDSEMVQALGINVRRVFTLVFAIGAGLAALGGAAIAPQQGVSPEMGLEFQLAAFIVVVIGGLGSIPGAAVGALLVGLARTFGDTLIVNNPGLPKWLPSASTVLLMAVVLLLRPAGLFGKRE